jgi:hypothetical protein
MYMRIPLSAQLQVGDVIATDNDICTYSDGDRSGFSRHDKMALRPVSLAQAGPATVPSDAVNPVDALRELRETLTALDGGVVEVTRDSYELAAAKREARTQVLRSIAVLARTFRMVKLEQPKEGA